MVKLRTLLARARLGLPPLVPQHPVYRIAPLRLFKPSPHSSQYTPSTRLEQPSTSLLRSKRRWSPTQATTGEVEFTARNEHLDFALQSLPAYRFRAHKSPVARPGFFRSAAYGRLVWSESTLEDDLLLSCECDPAVDAYCEQPARLRIFVDGRLSSYPPDVLVSVCGELWFLEAKYEAQAAKPKAERRYETIGLALSAVGFGFAVVTEHDIREPVRHTNVMAVDAEVQGRVPHERSAAVISLLAREGIVPLGEVCARTGVSLTELCHLARAWRISLGVDELPLGDTTPVALRPARPKHRGEIAR